MDSEFKAHLQTGLRERSVKMDDKQFSEGFCVDGRFIGSETDLWDFKKDWPFSYSDDYFLHIAKLICAFANTGGGLIIFNVDDKTRICATSKTKSNLDRISQSVSQILSDSPALELREYRAFGNEHPVLIVYPQKRNQLPIRFEKRQNQVGNPYWVRVGHETIAATAKHIPILFCRSETAGNNNIPPESALPPVPMQIRTFVGRLDIIYKIFSWLIMEEYPRVFLHGRGGSGKTAIVYEVAKHLAEFGNALEIGGGHRVDSIIFMTAKEYELNTITGKSQIHIGRDFSSSKELLINILAMGGWTEYSYLESISEKELSAQAQEFFDTTCCIIFIDDIDTLTTKGLDAGLELLYLLLARSRGGSRVIYTLRNVPTHSLANAIEVPGLSEDGEYQKFVSTCAKQFSVPEPEDSVRDGELKSRSERRPLIVETIIALRRNAGSYKTALELFELNAGAEARQYVFKREWDALPPDNRGRHLLAALALMGRPLAQKDLEIILQYDPGLIAGAIADAREMFIDVSDSGLESTYSLSALTRSFVESEMGSLTFIHGLRTRTEAFEKESLPDRPELSRLRANVGQILRDFQKSGVESKLREAWTAVTSSNLSEETTQDPRYKILLGKIACRMTPPDLITARDVFKYAVKFGFYPDIEDLKFWYRVEQESGRGVDQCFEICEIAESSKIYPERHKIDFSIWKASAHYQIGKDSRFTDPERSIGHLQNALVAHLTNLKRAIASDHPRIFKIEEYCRNTAFLFFHDIEKNGQKEDIARFCINIVMRRDVVVDPIETPLKEYLTDKSDQKIFRNSERQRVMGRLNDLRKHFIRADCWESGNCKERVIQNLTDGITRLEALTLPA